MTRQAYLDAYERLYENARDDGWPADRAALWAEAEATREIETPICGGCDGELTNGRCPSCEEPAQGMTQALRACEIDRENREMSWVKRVAGGRG